MSNDLEKKITKAKNILLTNLEGEKKTHGELLEEAKFALMCIKIKEDDPDYDFILNSIINYYERDIGIKVFRPYILEKDKNQSSWLYDVKDKKSHRFFERYKLQLRRDGFDEKSIDNIELTTEKILSRCANPNAASGKKRGLVVGDVQSGKTANYLALISMAYDYGYKTVVLLAGMTDSLRVQTQKRADKGLIGANSSTIGNTIEYCGVGEINKEHYVIPLTNRENDFAKFIRKNLNAQIKDFNKPVILVVKKNKKILESVAKKLQDELKGRDYGNLLIIDDEADNASVNTAKPDNDPTAINKAIRDIFNKFNVATYVGFTATPFANVFINPNDDQSYKDLFPSDFIVQLNSPSSYFGGEKVFTTDEDSRFIRRLDESEVNFFPVVHKKDDHFTALSDSLKEAIHSFLINNVVFTLRGRKNKHRSMMINITRFNDTQYQIRYKVEEYVKKLKNIIEQDSFKKAEDFIKNSDMKAIYDLFNSEFYDNVRTPPEGSSFASVSWSDIQNGLYEEIKEFQTVVVNSKVKSKERFDYDAVEKDGKGARVIAVGGFVLSRGLTLEGLMVSYYSRNAGAYDTLLQMCRWFGYRPGYEDLCRVYLSDENIDRFDAVIDAVHDLKEQFAEMERQGKDPDHFGLMVKESPDTLDTTLLITSRNKMQNTEEVIYHLNYGGVYADTSKIPDDPQYNKHNLKITKSFIEEIRTRHNAFREENDYLIVQGVSKFVVAEFVRRLKISPYNKKFEVVGLSEYMENSTIFPEWDIVIATGESDEGYLIDQFSLNRKGPMRRFVYDKGDTTKQLKIGGRNNRILDPGQFSAGVPSEKVKEELSKKKAEHKDKKNVALTAKDYLKLRDTPILIIYAMDLKPADEKSKMDSIDVLDKFDREPIMGYVIGFPTKESTERVKYRANIRKNEEIHKNFEFDDEDTDEGDEDDD